MEVKAVSPAQDLFGDLPEPAPRPRRQQVPVARPTHSWFFAVRPGAADAAHIDALANRLLVSHRVSGSRNGPDRLHISLDAIGHDDLDVDTVDAACRAADTVRLPAFEVRFDAALTFAGPGRPFVLVGYDGLHAVRALRDKLGRALADEGFKVRAAYTPHMTLCFDRSQFVHRTPIQPIAFRATEFALVKSHVGLSHHEVLRTWPLGAPEASV